MSISNLEKNVGRPRQSGGRKTVYLATGLLVIGLTIIYGGFSLLSGRNIEISADVETPPTPTDPDVSVTPPVPEDPDEEEQDTADVGQIDENRWGFPSGWSMISGQFLQGGNLEAFSQANLILYSFNDPAYPNRQWSTFPLGETSRTDLEDVLPISPFGYYVYNPGSETTTIDFSPRTEPVSADKIIARGWHLMYWPNAVANKDELLSKIQIKYQDGTVLTAKQAIESKYHRASIKIYGITNENVVDKSSALEEISGDSSQVEIFSAPPRSYFWIYLRRTKDRVVDISVLQ